MRNYYLVFGLRKPIQPPSTRLTAAQVPSCRLLALFKSYEYRLGSDEWGGRDTTAVASPSPHAQYISHVHDSYAGICIPGCY